MRSRVDYHRLPKNTPVSAERTTNRGRLIERTAHTHSSTVEHMRVQHRGGHVAMPQQFLHGADIISRLQQMRRERMAEGVARRSLADAGAQHCLVQ